MKKQTKGILCIVLAGGIPYPKLQLERDKTNDPYLVAAVTNASQGKNPGMYNEIVFPKVDPKYVDQEIIITEKSRGKFHARLPSGEKIPVTSEAILSEKRWLLAS